MLTQPCRGKVNTSFGRIWPKAITTPISNGPRAAMSERREENSLRSEWGWNTGIVCLRASSLIGDIAIFPPRPDGLSGWVRTAPTVMSGASMSACNVGTEKSGVPKKRTFMWSRTLFESVTAFRAPSTEELFFESTKVVHEEDAIEVIHLVLNTKSHEVFRLDTEEISESIL